MEQSLRPRMASAEQDAELNHMVRALAEPATRGDLFRALMDVQAVLEALSLFETAFLRRDSDGLRIASHMVQKTLRLQEERLELTLEDWKNAVD